MHNGVTDIMDIKERVKRVLEGLDLVDSEVKIPENRGTRVLAAVISPSFEAMEEADRRSMIWGQLIDELGDYDSRRVESIFTATPREVAEDIAEAEAAAPES
jgi:acid stress-induced BolA-like protein IbaG/YrbA